MKRLVCLVFVSWLSVSAMSQTLLYITSRYWIDIPFPELVSNISTIKIKSEVSQRFYFFDGQPGISVDEAYRYLQNRWMEKSIQIKRKQKEEKEGDKNGNEKSVPGIDLSKKPATKRKLVKSKTTNK